VRYQEKAISTLGPRLTTSKMKSFAERGLAKHIDPAPVPEGSHWSDLTDAETPKECIQGRDC
jgi:hypothetical protein